MANGSNATTCVFKGTVVTSDYIVFFAVAY